MADSASTLAIRNNPDRHRFEVDLGDGNFAIAEYTLPPGKIIFTHTEVPPEHEGKGIGSALIRYALAEARGRGLKVIPICPFLPPTCGSTPTCRTCWTRPGGESLDWTELVHARHFSGINGG